MTAAAATSRRPSLVHPEAALLDPARHELALADAARRLGRDLSAGEQRIDLVRLDRDLAAGKERLVAAIESERRSAASRFAREAVAGRSPRMRLHLSPTIRRALRGLYDAGRSAGRGELARAGYDPDRLPRALAAVPARLAVIETRIDGRLAELGVADEHRLAVAFDLSAATRGEIMGAVARLPGVRAIAADFTSVPAFAGLGSVWDEADAAGITSAWTYTAVMDDGTCDPCSTLDGETYESWDAIQEVLPDGGPNPDCDGGDRCRCRAVPEFGDQGSTGGGGGAPIAPDWLGDAATSDLADLRGVDESVGYLTREEQQARAAETGNAAGFHPHYLPQADYEANRWATPVVRDQHEKLLRIGRSIDYEAQERSGHDVTFALHDRLAEIGRELDANRQSVIDAVTANERARTTAWERLKADARRKGEQRIDTTAIDRDPTVIETERARVAAQEAQFARTRARQEIEVQLRDLYRDKILESLSEVRPMGATDEVDWRLGRGSLRAREMLDDAARVYPTDWIDATGRMDVHVDADSRGWHRTIRNADGTIQHEIQLNEARRETIAIHELGHAQEARSAAILDAERTFYDYRTTIGPDGRFGAWEGEQQRLERMGDGYGEGEVTRPDEFGDRYTGRWYGDPTLDLGGARAYELLTMGLQRLWTKPWTLDAEYRAWLLGILAAL